MVIKILKKTLETEQLLNGSNVINSVPKEPKQLYNKKNIFPIIRDAFSKLYIFLILPVISFLFNLSQIKAVDKIDGGNITIDGLGKIIKDLATKVQIFGIVLSFIALVIFTIQFIIGDDETKQRRKKTILYTLGGVALLILVPSIINFVIDTLG